MPHLDNEPQPQILRTVNHANTSWRVAVIGSAVILFATAMFCTSGLFYVYFMEEFGVSHGAASWPASAMGVTVNCAGLIVSWLQRFLSIFQISLLGSILLWTSLMLSALSPNVEMMTVFFGALHGLGIGFMENTMAVTVATSFLEHKSFAMGLKDGGRTLSVLVFPSIVSHLNSVYGVRSTLALCGALLMHVTALVLALRRRPITGQPLFGLINKEIPCAVTPTPTEISRLYKKSFHGMRSRTKVRTINYMSCKNLEGASTLKDNNVLSGRTKPILHCEINIYSGKKAVGGDASVSTSTISEGSSIYPAEQLRAHKNTASPTSQAHEFVRAVAKCCRPAAVSTPLRKNATASLRSDVERQGHDEDKKTVFQSAKSAGLFLLLADPRFYPLVFQNTVMSYSSIIFRSITVDYARDKGVPLGHAELMGTYCAATDLLVGHMALPFLADRRFVNRTLLVAITFALLSATLFALTISQGLVFFLSFFAAMSILISATASFSPVLITDYLGPRRVPLTWGASGLVTSPMLLATPSITGFSRDTMGSYDSLVRLIAWLAAVSSIGILLLSIAGRKSCTTANVQ